jgi:hypothetical protein
MNLRQSLNPAEFLGGARDLLRTARLSVVEIVFLTAALLFTLFIALFYITKVQPLNSEVETLKQRETELQLRLSKTKSDEIKRIEQASNAEKILSSLAQFEGYLKPDERGMTQIINEIDTLGKSNKILVGDATYRVAEAQPTVDENGNPLPQAAVKENKLNIYPALGIDTTVIGDYANLRRFLAELERSRQFLIINSLAFQGEADKVRNAAGKGAVSQIQLSSAEAIPVSLKIELDTYFQKPAVRKQ